jgi:hypothetical protein
LTLSKRTHPRYTRAVELEITVTPTMWPKRRSQKVECLSKNT